MRSGRTELATLVVTILTLFVPGVAPSLALGAPGAELGAEDSEVVETHREEEDPTGDQSDDTSPTGGQGDDASPAGDQGDDTEADTVPVAPEPVILDSETIPAGSPYIELEDLEVRMVEQALTTLGRTPEHDPWNRVVCTIDVMAYPIFLPEDALPTVFNVLHRTSRERTIRRAITLEVGEEFTTQEYQDAERALRDPFVYSVNAVVPVTSADPECVDVVVITRDVWSLSLAFVIEGNNRTLHDLYLSGVESNLFGTNDSISLDFHRGRGSWDFGPTYVSRRFAGSRISVTAQTKQIFDREIGGFEGSTNYLRVARPLYDSTVRWSWAVAGQYSDRIQRLYTDETLDTFLVGDEEVPERYRSTFGSAEAAATRSFGLSVKHNLTFALYVSARNAEPVPRDDSLSDEAVATYEDERLPRSERAVGPVVRWTWFENRHFRLPNYETYGVSEELQRGHTLTAGAQASEPGLGASTRFVRLSAGASYRLPIGEDAFVHAGFEPSMRVDDEGPSDLGLAGSMRFVTPRWVAGRFVARVTASTVFQNDANTLLSLGSDTGLRGYASGFAKGDRSFVTNVEWRSEPLRILLARLGMVVFYDGGAVWSEGEQVDFYPSLGLGARLVIPQFGTRVRVVDLGFPLRNFRGPVLTYGIDQSF